MNPAANKDSGKMKRFVIWYNLIPNLIWSIINLAPIVSFCFIAMPSRLVIIFLAISVLACAIPNSFFEKLQVSKTIGFYKKIGIEIVQKYTQNGEVINRMIRKKFPHYKIIQGRVSLKKQLKQTYFFEKFHVVMLVFFVLTTVYALKERHSAWALIFTVNNLLYNVYPILLQQYIRLRLNNSIKRG